jgi:hypothetical protein
MPEKSRGYMREEREPWGTHISSSKEAEESTRTQYLQSALGSTAENKVAEDPWMDSTRLPSSVLAGKYMKDSVVGLGRPRDNLSASREADKHTERPGEIPRSRHVGEHRETGNSSATSNMHCSSTGTLVLLRSSADLRPSARRYANRT